MQPLDFEGRLVDWTLISSEVLTKFAPKLPVYNFKTVSLLEDENNDKIATFWRRRPPADKGF